jgi:hypothetical protein
MVKQDILCGIQKDGFSRPTAEKKSVVQFSQEQRLDVRSISDYGGAYKVADYSCRPKIEFEGVWQPWDGNRRHG